MGKMEQKIVTRTRLSVLPAPENNSTLWRFPHEKDCRLTWND
jgi:hypothetical protein